MVQNGFSIVKARRVQGLRAINGFASTAFLFSDIAFWRRMWLVTTFLEIGILCLIVSLLMQFLPQFVINECIVILSLMRRVLVTI